MACVDSTSHHITSHHMPACLWPGRKTRIRHGVVRYGIVVPFSSSSRDVSGPASLLCVRVVTALPCPAVLPPLRSRYTVHAGRYVVASGLRCDTCLPARPATQLTISVVRAVILNTLSSSFFCAVEVGHLIYSTVVCSMPCGEFTGQPTLALCYQGGPSTERA